MKKRFDYWHLIKLALINLGLVILIHEIVVLSVLYYLDSATRHGEKIEVPTLVGLSSEEAKDLLTSLDLGFEIVDSVYCPCLPAGTVVEQLIDPTNDTIKPICSCNTNFSGTIFSNDHLILPSGVSVKSQRRIPLRLSKDREFVEAPNLIDKLAQFAEDVTLRRGLKVKIKYKPSINEDGIVMEQYFENKTLKAGEKIPIGSEITLIVGQNLLGEPISIPNVVGMYRNQAIALLESMKMTYIINCPGCVSVLDSISYPILKQVPEYYEGATVFKGTQFTLTIFPENLEENLENE